MHKGEGTGRWDEDKAEGVGRGSAYKGEGERRQAGRGVRLAEAPDFSTVVPNTGSACSTPKPLQPAR